MMYKLHVYIITWNSSTFIEDTIRWYKEKVPGCRITIYDNMSSDNTSDICKNYGCEVISFNTKEEMDEKTLMAIRELCWLNPTHNSEWVIICDDDEWVDVSEEMLDDTWNINKCVGYELFGQDGDKMEDLVYGVESAGYCKMALFNKTQIRRMNFGAGSHSANPEPRDGFEIIYNPNPVAMYHTKWRGWNHGLNRQKITANRVSQDSRRKGWNFHYGLPEETHLDYYTNGFNNRKKVR